jgi:branched-chain amino acid transport system ATP-binding protein
MNSAGATPGSRLSARDITVRFGGVTALQSVDIDVPPASIVGLIGPNGAGKSTLFSVLSGLRRPAQGRVFMDGIDITTTSPQARAGRGLARTFQHPELFTGLTVREHVMLAYRIKHTPRRIWFDTLAGGGFRYPPPAESKRVDDLIQSLNLAQVEHDSVIGLPLGLARLVEIARSIAREPTVLLLDEASSGLDATETDELAQVLRNLVDDHGVSLLLVEHDVDLVMGLADQINVLDFGACIAQGTPDQIRSSPEVRAAYLGEDLGSPTELAVP